PWTFREVRLLEILQPHLVQTIKTIYLSEALKKFQALARVLAEVPVPLGLADRDFCLLFQNESLQKLAALSDGKKLPEDLIRALEQEVNRMKEPFPPKSPLPALPFVRVGGQSRRLEVNRIDSGQEAERGDWLLRFKPVEDSYSRSNLLMQEAGLTPREMEVTILLRDGLVNQEIADRLWIRPSTVQNHVKQIYQKFGVHSRTQLLARLGNGGGT
ncbi:MAG: LuxR family transcriptional regulator, partial [Nitrospinaceae bacterium]|nr:LuxR family transcriptional regulator [Nitrospinaceae bacterium]